MMNTTIFTKEGIMIMKKAMSVILLLALTITLNAGVVGTFPQGDNGGIAVMSDEPPITELHF